MDLKRLVAVLMLVVVFELVFVSLSCGNMVFKVQHKYPGRFRNLTQFRAHDSRRRGRFLSAVDIPIGGDGHPAETGLYFGKIGLGNPSKDYYVQMDTGSDLLWVNCINCDRCPTKSEIGGVKLTLYDPASSSSSSRVYCNDDFCTSTYNGVLPGCTKDLPCQYSVTYGDGSSTAGYFIKDTVQFERVSGNLQTAVANGTVIFGCGAQQSGELGSSGEALDGIIGFGQANSSLLSQLASIGKVKKIFSHCLDNINGGGIFAIGEVVSPKVNTTPMVPNQPHYNVNMKEIEVGGKFLQLPTDIFDSGDKRGTIIDSGTTLAYFPEVVYDSLMNEIRTQQPGLSLHAVEEQFLCFQYRGNVDDGFPVVKFHFDESLILTVYPHDYLFQIKEDIWCFGWQNSAMQSKDGKYMTLLGDLVLSNKLVLYDIENQAIGWTEHNCSSSIKVKDDNSGSVYTVGGSSSIKVKDDNSGSVYSVGAQDLSSASHLLNGRISALLLLLFVVLHRFT